MVSADMGLFMGQNLLVGLRIIERRIDKDVVGKRAGGAVAADFNEAKTAIPDNGIGVGLIIEHGDLQQEVDSEKYDAQQVPIKKQVQDQRPVRFCSGG